MMKETSVILNVLGVKGQWMMFRELISSVELGGVVLHIQTTTLLLGDIISEYLVSLITLIPGICLGFYRMSDLFYSSYDFLVFVTTSIVEVEQTLSSNIYFQFKINIIIPLPLQVSLRSS